MFNAARSFFQTQPTSSTSVSLDISPPYYEVSDKKGNVVACISGSHHELVPDSKFEPAPRMQQCFDRAKIFLVESDRTAAKDLIKRQLLKQGLSAESIDRRFREVELGENSIDRDWEKQASAQDKPVKGLESPVNALKAAEKIALEEENTPHKQQQECKKWTRDLFLGAEVKTQDYFLRCFIDRNKTLPEFFARNEIMASGIHQSIQANGLSFVTVGFGHCLGKKGVPQILKEKYGWDVKEIKPNPPSKIHVFNPRYE